MRPEEERSEIYLRLTGVHIENLSWADVIAKYDRPETFFIVIPHTTLCPDYKHNFILKDFIELADTLKNIKGTFVLSINDHPDTRKVFSQFIRKKVSLLYTIGSKGPTKANELIYSNYELKEYKEPTLFQTDWDSVNF